MPYYFTTLTVGYEADTPDAAAACFREHVASAKHLWVEVKNADTPTLAATEVKI
jgi:hypothetical protein